MIIVESNPKRGTFLGTYDVVLIILTWNIILLIWSWLTKQDIRPKERKPVSAHVNHLILIFPKRLSAHEPLVKIKKEEEEEEGLLFENLV